MIGIIKGDIRYKYLNEMIDDSILSSNLSDFYNIDTLVLTKGYILISSVFPFVSPNISTKITYYF